MAHKGSALADAVPSSWLAEIARTELAGSEDISPRDTDSVVREMTAWLADGQLVPGKRIQADNYQVALISLPDPSGQSGADGTALATMNLAYVLPVTWNDLVTRLCTESGRSASNQVNDVAIFGTIWVKLSSMEVRRAGEPVTLTALEFKLLRYFLSHPAKVISRDELLDEVWGFENYPCTRTVDSHMWRLRRKLEADPARPEHFHTVHSAGYKFVP